MCLYTDHQVGCLPHRYVAVQERHCGLLSSSSVQGTCTVLKLQENAIKGSTVFYILLTTDSGRQLTVENRNICLFDKMSLFVKWLEASAL